MEATLRVTIGERLGLLVAPPKASKAPAPEVTCDDPVPSWVQPEVVVRLADLPSAKTVPVEVVPEPKEGPPRVRGEMVWLHKTAPVLVIEGQRLSPEDHVAGRRR